MWLGVCGCGYVVVVYGCGIWLWVCGCTFLVLQTSEDIQTEARAAREEKTASLTTLLPHGISGKRRSLETVR